MPALIVNADDFGRTAGINKGIIEAHIHGIVTSTTAMINHPEAGPGLDQQQEQAPFLGVGLHLNLTSGRPVSATGEVSSLLVDGRFHPAPGLAPFAVGWQPEQIEAELRAQVARFIALAGRPPTHLDSHHHAVFMFPAAFRVMLALAREYGLPLRRPILMDTALATSSHWILEGLSPFQRRQIAEELHALAAEASDVIWPDRFVDTFYDRTAILGELLTILTTLPGDGVTELMCHPGYANDLDSVYNVQREGELKWLTHPSAKEVVVAEGIRLMSFADLS